MSRIFDILNALASIPCVTGAEISVTGKELVAISPLLKEAQTDASGNIFFLKPSKNPDAKTVLLEAHRDEIGLCVKEILDGGFVSVSPCGGIDPSVLPGTECIIFGKNPISAIATSLPPHLTKKEDGSAKISFDKIYLDTGISSKNTLKKLISIGDPVVFKSTPLPLLNGKITGKGLDNKVGVAAVILAMESITDCENHVMVLFSVSEESTSRGVRAFCKGRKIDLALVLDAGFAHAPGLDETQCIDMGKGPSISYTDTLSRKASNWAIKRAQDRSIPLQVIAEPGGTGTSATALQLENGGLPCAVISIPIHNMHTPAEVVLEKDILDTSKLIEALVSSCDLPREEAILRG